ncbi:MAG: MarR family winged helix-turn-helix transcriptional regulator, partial [Niameybacter sp.]
DSPFKDLSITEMHVIEAIGLGSRTMTDVADQLGITVGTLTTSINRLVKKEYVSRRRSEEDRRYVEIEITQKGKLAYRVHEAFHQIMVQNMIEGLSNEDNEVLIKSLTRLSDFFREKYHLVKK